jgi:asparagine synthase (glutamine-hydrolysing)
MCGILGCVQVDAKLKLEHFKKMLDSLSQRGPDGHGTKILCEGLVLLGHRRLAIIDLNLTGTQPMSNEDGTVWITFNGEIYNYRALRIELTGLGHHFHSKSDTEVIVHAWEEWGRNCVHRLRGIFAFGLWDSRTRELFLARDQMGVKPLYYSQYASRFVFASQPKAILADDVFSRAIDATGLRDYFAFGYVPRDRCAFKNMHKLPAGHWLSLKDGNIEVREYWRIEYRPQRISVREAEAEVRKGIISAVETQLVSDVPVGCFLSGGIDSSLLVAIANKHIDLRTFTIGFDEAASDERKHARTVAERFNTLHHEKVLTRLAVQASLSQITEFYDEPFDPNGPMPFMEVARLARENDTSVALGGDGADELFLGYLRYDDFDRPTHWRGQQRSRYWQVLRWMRLQNERQIEPGDLERYFAYEGCLLDSTALLSETFASQAEGSALDTLRPYFQPGLPALVAAQLADMNHYLVDHILCKVDRAAMAYGVEARVPFLDIELVKTAFSIPITIKYSGGERKWLLKRAARSLLDSDMLTPRKKGFSSPLVAWLDQDLQRWGDCLINDGILIGSGVIRSDWATALFPVGRRQSWSSTRAWWLLLAAELWARRWISGGSYYV